MGCGFYKIDADLVLVPVVGCPGAESALGDEALAGWGGNPGRHQGGTHMWILPD